MNKSCDTRILMVAPQPFFEPHGAPFCVYQQIMALITLGYKVDLITYPFGEDVELPNLRIYRAPKVPFIHEVKPGFSLAKFPLDLVVFLTVFWKLCTGKYRFLCTHEESALIGMLLAPLFRCQHLYYMHCDLSQLVPQKLRGWMKTLQRYMIRSADAIIAFYPELTWEVNQISPGHRVYTLLPTAVDERLPVVCKEDVLSLRHFWTFSTGPLLLYTGTLEHYQGLEMLLYSVLIVRNVIPNVRYLIVGGTANQVRRFEQLTLELGLIENVRFTGQRPLEEMPYYMALADVLLSPRSTGTHVPLKLYTYLRSGKAILATGVLAHTQVLTGELALLVAPTPQGLAQGALTLLQQPEQAQALGKSSQKFAQEHYSWPVFLEKSREIYDEFISHK